MAAERDDASAKMEFETAAAIHSRLDKLTPVLQQLPSSSTESTAATQ